MPVDPDALWREAMAETSPFRRAQLLERAATAVIDVASVRLRRYCVRSLDGDEARGEDAAQRAFLTFWTVLGRFAGRSALETFLFGIARNVCLLERRDAGRAARLTAQHEDVIRALVHPDDLRAWDEARERQARLRELERVLETMEAREAWLLRARLVDELGYAEMLAPYQRRFGPHITTVEGLRTAFFHARRRLESELGARS